MKVLHINRNYIVSTLHQAMIEHLDETGTDSTVFVPTDNKVSDFIVPNENVIVSECFTKRDRFIFDIKQRKIRVAIEKCCKVGDFDCIHAYTLFTDGNCAMKLSQKYEIPFLVAVRNTDVNVFFKRFPHLRKRGVEVMRQASVICFLSEAYRRQVFDSYVPERYQEELQKKVCIVPNGIDDFWFQNRVEEPDIVHAGRIHNKEIRLVYAGDTDKNKNIPSTLKAMDILQKEGWNVSLTVVGRIVDKKEFEKIAAHPFVKYIPAQPKEKLIEVYRENDIFIMPSFTESFGLVYVEAMSQGIPVIYSVGQGFDGQFPEGTVGYHVNAREPADIAAAIKRAAEHYEKISSGCAAAADKFCWSQLVKRYTAIYESIKKES